MEGEQVMAGIDGPRRAPIALLGAGYHRKKERNLFDGSERIFDAGEENRYS